MTFNFRVILAKELSRRVMRNSANLIERLQSGGTIAQVAGFKTGRPSPDNFRDMH